MRTPGSGEVEVKELRLEDYVAGVVSGEMPASFPPEALKAQAVAARSFALTRKLEAQAAGRDHDIASGVVAQVWTGAPERRRRARPRRRRPGEVLVVGREPVEAYFHAACGGRTEGGARRRSGATCRTSSPWSAAAATARRACAGGVEVDGRASSPRSRGCAGRPTAARVVARTATGRAERVEIAAGGRAASVAGGRPPPRLGWSRLPSLAFDVRAGGRAGSPSRDAGGATARGSASGAPPGSRARGRATATSSRTTTRAPTSSGCTERSVKLSDFDFALPEDARRAGAGLAARRLAPARAAARGARRAPALRRARRAARARRPPRLQRHEGHPGAARRPQGERAARSSSSSASRSRAGSGGAGAPWARRRSRSAPGARARLRRARGAGARRRRGRGSTRSSSTARARRSRPRSRGPGASRCRRTSAAAPGARDRERYQTIWARAPGSAAAPTAGPPLHRARSSRALERARRRAARRSRSTSARAPSCRSAATSVEEHRMHAERYEVSPPRRPRRSPRAARAAAASSRSGPPSVRTLESAFDGARVAPGAGRTALFIRPGHAFRAVDALVTNFHLPALDAARARLRLRRARSGCSPPTARPSRGGTASSATATRCCCSEPTAPRARVRRVL